MEKCSFSWPPHPRPQGSSRQSSYQGHPWEPSPQARVGVFRKGLQGARWVEEGGKQRGSNKGTMGLISGSRGTLGFSLPWRQPGSRRQVGPRLRSVGLSKKCLPSPHSHLFLLIPVRTRREGGDGGAEPGTPLPGHLLSGSDAGWSAQSPVPPGHAPAHFPARSAETPSPGASPSAGLLPRSGGPASQRRGGGLSQPLPGLLRTQRGAGSWGQTPQTGRMRANTG